MSEHFFMRTDGDANADPRGLAMIPHRPAVAIVDDDEAVRDSMRFLLEMYDFDVRIYQSASEFLRDIPAVGCLVVDYHMPGLNGLDLVAELRERGSVIPTIIMITASTDPSVDRRAAQLGVRHVLRKPFFHQALLKAIRDHLDH